MEFLPNVKVQTLGINVVSQNLQTPPPACMTSFMNDPLNHTVKYIKYPETNVWVGFFSWFSATTS